MSQPEVFNLATWNFLLGEREAEEILRDPRIRSVVVRGGIGTVLPTVSCLRDMRFAGWRDFPELAVHVPVNTLSSAFPPLSEEPPQGKLMETLLSKTYGIRCAKALEPYDRQVILLLGEGLENPALAQQASALLKDLGEGKLIFVLPSGKGLPANLRALLPRSWSAAYWDGRNAFFSSSVEEAAVEAEPAHITVIGADWQHLFYTAIGAVDFFLVQDARFRNPSELPLWEILEMG
ncbi:MAG: hypothetical protein HYU64_18425, partial [Armatimonadetes bacterium]|nr:hypothetical protein [Armatimonadota bacterium]